ncbi:sensor histidine kinase [Variovorax sp. VNK109]|jgi:two-component system OmpR family sensor kinase|uniref:sensor histidine kinase n=1 Tax=Variovorax sp. VNK109 TaxID=3400919 RepID=UPI003BFD74B4
MFASNPFTRRLYVRIWLAIAGGLLVLTLVIGWAWRVTADANRPPPQSAPRDVVVRDANGHILSTGSARTVRPPNATEGIEFVVNLTDGETLTLTLPPRPSRRPPPPFWAREPFGFAWLLALVGVAVTVGVYPVVRRLTKGLEGLQRGVQRWGEGDLSVRVPVTGKDEVADLSARFNESAERIERLVNSHKALLANASHELRSPLARIRMGLELMGSQPSSAFKDEISRNIAELDQLIGEILLASRLDVKEADMGPLETVDLTGLAAEECAHNGAELEAGTHGLSVQGVSRLLRRVIRNLLENARRYGGAGDVTLTLLQTGRFAEVRVADHGPGVPADQRTRIFEPFYRLPGASEREGGVGLGLALVKSIVERHGGTVHCEDNPGGGACFVVRLPLPDVA